MLLNTPQRVIDRQNQMRTGSSIKLVRRLIIWLDMCSAPRRSLPLVPHRKTLQKVCVFPKKSKCSKCQLKNNPKGMCFPQTNKNNKDLVHYSRSSLGCHCVADVGENFGVFWFVVENTWFMQRFLDVIGNILVFWGKHNGFAWFSMTEWSVKICHAKLVSGLK